MKAAQSRTTGDDKVIGEAKDRSVAPAWDRGNLKKWRRGLPKERRDADLGKLSRIFNLAAKVPELRDALEWAKNHNIDFIVDHAVKAGGYYTVGTGVVAIAANSCNDDGFAAGVIVHEVRHAWQDYYGMIPTTGKSFTDYYMRLAVIEADAMAHEKLAERQHALSAHIDRLRSAPPAAFRRNQIAGYEEMLKKSGAETDRMWSDFTRWYVERAGYYGNNALKSFGHRLGLPGVDKPDINAEYRPYEGREDPVTEGIDLACHEELRRLGKGFRGGNYFNHAAREVLDRQFLSPRRAAILFSGSDIGSNPQANEIRRRELLLKAHKRRAAKP
jgi:hypothetical protein